MAEPPARSRWRVVLKLAGLALFIGLFVGRPDIVERVWRGLRATDLRWFGAAMAIIVATQLVAALRISYLARINDEQVPLGMLFCDVMVATGLNAMLLIGAGMVYRIKRISDVIGSATRSTALVVLDRGIGFAALLLGGLLAFMVFGTRTMDFEASPTTVLVGGLVVCVILAIGLVVFPRKMRSLVAQVRPILGSVFGPSRMLVLAGISVLTFAGSVSSVYCLARGLGIELPFSVFVYATPMVAVATVIPISVGGIGVRELGYMFFLGPLGFDESAAISLGVSQYATFVLVAVLGVVLTFLRARLGPASPGHYDLPATDPAPHS